MALTNSVSPRGDCKLPKDDKITMLTGSQRMARKTGRTQPLEIYGVSPEPILNLQIMDKCLKRIRELEEELAEAKNDIAVLSAELDKVLSYVVYSLLLNKKLSDNLTEQRLQNIALTERVAGYEEGEKETRALVERLEKELGLNKSMALQREKELLSVVTDLNELISKFESNVKLTEEVLKQYELLDRVQAERDYQYQQLKKQNDILIKNYSDIRNKYGSLSNSKLGQLTLFLWRWRKRVLNVFKAEQGPIGHPTN